MKLDNSSEPTDTLLERLRAGDERAFTELFAERFTARGGWSQPPAMWPESHPEEVLLRRETATALEDAVEGLPANQRAVLTLRDIEGVDAREVCNTLSISETNQRVLLHRARTRVRAALEIHLKRG